MTSGNYFGKMNPTLGSVVPLAMFYIRVTMNRNSKYVWINCLHLGDPAILEERLHLRQVLHVKEAATSHLREKPDITKRVFQRDCILNGTHLCQAVCRLWQRSPILFSSPFYKTSAHLLRLLCKFYLFYHFSKL